MKKIVLGCLVLACIFSACGQQATVDRALEIRSQLLQAPSLAFSCTVTADFRDSVFVFSASCEADQQGQIHFTVTDPPSLAGISGTLCAQGGKLTFDGTALDFGLLSDAMPTPISAPYTLLQALRNGNIRAYGQEDGVYHMVVDESYHSDSLQLEAWFAQDSLPFYAEISYQGRKLLSMELQQQKS